MRRESAPSASVAVLVGVLCLGTVGPVAAQQAPAKNAIPSVSLLHAGAARLLEDIDTMISLTSPEEQKQKKVLRDFFVDIVLPGIDMPSPVRMDVLTDSSPVRYRPHFPVKVEDLKTFRKNLDDFGIKSKLIAANLYQLEGAFDGLMRYKNGYASIGKTRDDVPLTLADPKLEVAALLKSNVDAGAVLRNVPGQGAARRKNFDSLVRKELLGTLKQKKDEKPGDFAVRKLAFEHQLNEFERLYAESESLTAGIDLDNKTRIATGNLTLVPEANTSLAQSIALLQQKPSRFANVDRSSTSVLSLRLDNPLDEMRKKQIADFADAARDNGLARLDVAEGRTPEEKASAKQMVQLAHQLFKSAAAAGLLDAFVEVDVRPSGMHTLVCAAHVAQGQLLDQIVALVPTSKNGRKATLNVAKAGDMAIHKVELPFDHAADLKSFFGPDLAVYGGGTKDTVWLAAGEGAIAQLQKAVAAASSPPPATPQPYFADAYAKVGPLLELLEKISPAKPADKTDKPAAESKFKRADGKAAKKAELDRATLRKSALDAFRGADDDVFSFRLRREGANVVGVMDLQPGILRFVGKTLAKFSKDTLE